MSAQHRFEWVQRSTTKWIGDLGFRATGKSIAASWGPGTWDFQHSPHRGRSGRTALFYQLLPAIPVYMIHLGLPPALYNNKSGGSCLTHSDQNIGKISG